MSAGPWSARRLHLLGIGGAGMSAYARAAHALGARVSGSDRAESPYLDALRREGVAEVSVGHAAEALPGGDDVEVVYSSAIVPEESPELRAAGERGLRIAPRAVLLGELSALRRTIAVAGAHGKTTTASMLVEILVACGMDPGFLIGGMVRSQGTNGRWSEGEWLVVEADESDRSLLALSAEIAVLTNVELDHHAAFGSELELRRVLHAFLAAAPRAVVQDRPEVLALRGEGETVAFRPEDVRLADGGSTFSWRGREVRVGVPGEMNAANAAAALEAARLAGAPEPESAAALAGYAGAGRRLEPVGRTARGARVLDDYAHHPTEVAATLRAVRPLARGRVLAAFQPHLFSRTRRLAREFGAALVLAELVVVLDVYPARERAEEHPGVSGLLVAAAAADADRGVEVLWLPDPAIAARLLAERAGPEDVVVVMGAGDSDRLARALVA